ncbi:MAG: hypothetical protein IM647_07425 [Phenylobacterium sp.]|uniref:hypothetical protein n=1 Tax=Phenylobacterium sp. TaxID=1871053 RepID=UPI0025FE9F52|nr:hypothetical protein [Phenylobacterium sp.]MCA3550133.1 hypothetical protein [Rhodobacter sp.]MCA6264699.1 hypothetical protein [Phenylobacterium sp.]MCA6269175.1 hypothetical protein [Phenylobacterium sp.]MCA6274461.1 hypothetical protein [Phenylobacterium sp.]MCA6282033.1 hypothetical protein [Phenylobacterium sp.]
MNLIAKKVAQVKARWAIDRQLTEYERRIREARSKHRAVKPIEAERQAYMHGLLGGGR